MAATLNTSRNICLNWLISFENQIHHSKAGKSLNNLDMFGVFYLDTITNWWPIKESQCNCKGQNYSNKL